MNRQPIGIFRFQRMVRPLLRWVAIVAIGFVFLALFAPPAKAQGPCCSVTAIQHSGIVTAKVNATGQTFQFKVTNQALLQSLRVGGSVYANFQTRQVSLDGKTICCTIVAVGPAPQAPVAKAPGPPQPGVPSQPAPAPPGTTPACCGITSIDARENLASAKENRTGQTFQFKANNPAAMGSLKVGESIYANFSNRQVSLDGKNVFGTIVSLAGAPENAAVPPARTPGQSVLTTATNQPGSSGSKVPRLAQVQGEGVLHWPAIQSLCQQFAAVLPPPPPVAKVLIGTLDAQTGDFTWNPNAVLRQISNPPNWVNFGPVFSLQGIRPAVVNLNPIISGPIGNPVFTGAPGIATTQIPSGVGAAPAQGRTGTRMIGNAPSPPRPGGASPLPTSAAAGSIPNTATASVIQSPGTPAIGSGALQAPGIQFNPPHGHTPPFSAYFIPVKGGGVDMQFSVINRPAGATTSLTIEGRTVQFVSEAIDIVVPMRFGEEFSLTSGSTTFADAVRFDRPPQLGCFTLEAFPYTIIYEPPGSASSQSLGSSMVLGTQVQTLTGQTTSQTNKVDTPYSTVTDMIDLLGNVGKLVKIAYPDVGEAISQASDILSGAWGKSETEQGVTHTVTNSHTMNIANTQGLTSITGPGLGPGKGDIIKFLARPTFVWLVAQDNEAQQLYITLSLLGYDFPGSDTAQALRDRADPYIPADVQAALLASDPLAPECTSVGFLGASTPRVGSGGIGPGGTINYPTGTGCINNPSFTGNSRFIPAVPPRYEWTGTQSLPFHEQHTMETSDLSVDSTVTTVTTKEQAGWLSYIFPGSVPQDASNSTGLTESTSTLTSTGETIDDTYTLGTSSSNPDESHLVNIFYDNLYGTFAVVEVPPGPVTHSGTVTAGKLPAARVRVSLVVNGRIYDQTTTDAQGRFFLHPPNLKPGNYVLVVGKNEQFQTSYRGSPLTSLSIELKARP